MFLLFLLFTFSVSFLLFLFFSVSSCDVSDFFFFVLLDEVFCMSCTLPCLLGWACYIQDIIISSSSLIFFLLDWNLCLHVHWIVAVFKHGLITRLRVVFLCCVYTCSWSNDVYAYVWCQEMRLCWWSTRLSPWVPPSVVFSIVLICMVLPRPVVVLAYPMRNSSDSSYCCGLYSSPFVCHSA